MMMPGSEYRCGISWS